MDFTELEDHFKRAALTERRLPRHTIAGVRAAWPEYLYTAEERALWIEPEPIRIKPTAADITHLDKMLQILNMLGTQKTKRIVLGKRVLWLRVSTMSYRKIARAVGMSPNTCCAWYKQDMTILSKKVQEI